MFYKMNKNKNSGNIYTSFCIYIKEEKIDNMFLYKWMCYETIFHQNLMIILVNIYIYMDRWI